MTDLLSREEIRRRVDALGPWFHNLDLAGVKTAPDHFLGDYPSVKWKRFSTAIPDDLHGKCVLDIGCNAGFYSIQMKQRGKQRIEEHRERAEHRDASDAVRDILFARSCDGVGRDHGGCSANRGACRNQLCQLTIDADQMAKTRREQKRRDQRGGDNENTARTDLEYL